MLVSSALLPSYTSTAQQIQPTCASPAFRHKLCSRFEHHRTLPVRCFCKCSCSLPRQKRSCNSARVSTGCIFLEIKDQAHVRMHGKGRPHQDKYTGKTAGCNSLLRHISLSDVNTPSKCLPVTRNYIYLQDLLNNLTQVFSTKFTLGFNHYNYDVVRLPVFTRAQALRKGLHWR